MTIVNPDGHTDLPAGHVAAIATFLEMRAPPQRFHAPERAELGLRRIDRPDPEAYRALFRRVGRDWLWASRLRPGDEALTAILGDPNIELHLPERAGETIGLAELDFRISGEAKITFFGLVPDAVGQGIGHWLMQQTLQLAWRDGIARVWLHTCTLDHPKALDFYLRSGFRPYARKLEMFPDPRLSGLLPRTAAPHVPIIER